jgi:hypothetical protein
MASPGTKSAAVVLLVALAGAGGGWAWIQHQRAEARRSATTLVEDASAGLREGLRPRAGAGGAALEAGAKALDERLAAFARVRTSGERALAYGAEEYALSARQVLRDLGQEERRRAEVAEGLRALAQHMNYANRRTPGFHRRALQIKADLEKRYYEYRVAADALARELDALADVRARLAPLVDASALLDAQQAADARKRADEAARRVADDMQRARRMAGPGE